MNQEPITLYIRDNTDSIRVWSIEVEDYTIVISHGLLGGTLQTQEEFIDKGKQGRSIEEQIKSRVASRVSKQIDKGYSTNIEDARNRPTNRLGFKKPMLAQPIKNIKSINYDSSFVQYKYDGHRCLITRHQGQIIAYSRNGKLIESIEHILDAIEENGFLEEGQTLDGELYMHGVALQTITSWVKRKQKNSSKLSYMLYDIIEDAPYNERLKMIRSFNGGYVIAAPTENLSERDNIASMTDDAIKHGFEGLILRHTDTSYEDGKRSKSLVKVKQCLDGEFVVQDIIESADGWGVLDCGTFRVSAPGTIAEKKEVLYNKERHIGLRVRVEFAQYTKGGIPFHPVAVSWCL